MDKFTETLAGGLRRFAMASVGAITLTIDKSKKIIDQLAARGEISAAEGQAVCDDLQKKLTDQVSAFTQRLRKDYENLSFDQMLSRADRLTPEQKQRLIDRLTKTQEPGGDKEKAPAPKEEARSGEESAEAESAEGEYAQEDLSEEAAAAGDILCSGEPDTISAP